MSPELTLLTQTRVEVFYKEFQTASVNGECHFFLFCSLLWFRKDFYFDFILCVMFISNVFVWLLNGISSSSKKAECRKRINLKEKILENNVKISVPSLTFRGLARFLNGTMWKMKSFNMWRSMTSLNLNFPHCLPKTLQRWVNCHE